MKKDTVVLSSLERTRRLLKSRIKVESGVTREDPAVRLRERLKKISDIKKTEASKQETEETTEFKNEIILNDVDEFCRAVSQAKFKNSFVYQMSITI